MLTVSHRKTYTLTVHVVKTDDEYAMIKDAMECRDSEPFKHIEEIGEIIEQRIKPLVPFKKTHGWSFRIYEDKSFHMLKMEVTFRVGKPDVDYV